MNNSVCWFAAFVLAAGCMSEPPPRESVLTDARALTAGPAKAVGEDCTSTGKDGCSSGLCIKLRQGFPGEHVCTRACQPGPNGDGCPASWNCAQVYQRDDGYFCLPPSTWTARVAPPPAARVAVAARPLSAPFARGSWDGGRP